MIEVSGLRKRYRGKGFDTLVLQDVHFSIARGESVAIMGPSGSGKSTLLHVLGGLDRDYEGSVCVEGQDLRALRDNALAAYRNQTLGFVFQSFYLLPHLTAAENVALPAIFAPAHDNTHHPRARASEILGRVGLADKVDALPRTLSGGQKQRVAIARAMYGEPRLLLCDEPTGNLDQKTSKDIMDLFAELRRTANITFVVVTHDPSIAKRADRRLRVEHHNVHEDAV